MFLKTQSRLKTQIIINPESDRGRTGKKWSQIKTALNSFLNEFSYEFTEKPFQAAEISRAAIKDGNELIVGVGGDGTMNEIANGFFEDKKIINPDTTLGLIPSGTGSDLSRSLNIPPGLKNAMEIITQAPARKIDAGRVVFKGNEGGETDRFFLNIADFGIGGEVVRRVTQNRKKRKTSSYLKSLLSAIISFKPKKLIITIDEQELPAEEYMIGAVSNGKVFGKGMKIAPNADLQDGLFDVVLVKGMKMFEFCKNAWRLYSGTHLSHPKISLIRGHTILVRSADHDPEEVLLELDGEQLGTVPATFSLLPRTFPVKSYL